MNFSFVTVALSAMIQQHRRARDTATLSRRRSDKNPVVPEELDRTRDIITTSASPP